MFEVFIRSGAIAPLKWIRDSTTMRMMTFMTMSAFILDAVQNAVGHPDDYLPWLVKPIRKRGDFDDTRHSKQSIFDKFLPRSNHVCLHSSSCGEYLWEVSGLYAFRELDIILPFGINYRRSKCIPLSDAVWRWPRISSVDRRHFCENHGSISIGAFWHSPRDIRRFIG